MPSLLREILLGDLVPFGNPADWFNFLVMSVLFYLLGGNFWGALPSQSTRLYNWKT